jgi:predicted Zn-dependent peptidase
LPNGVRLLTVPLEVESVTVLVLVGVGSRHESADKNGLSHFLEHMLFKGTERRPTPFDISVEIDRIGGEINAFTAKDHTGYYVKAASRHLSLAVDLLGDMLLHSKFDPAEIDKDRSVILQEIMLRNDTPTIRIGDHFEELLFAGHALGRTIDGEPEVVKRLRRQDFLDHLEKYYRPENLVVTIAGGFEQDEARRLTSRLFGSLVSDPVPKPRLGEVDQSEPRVVFHGKKTDQTHFIVGVRAYPYNHEKHYPAGLLATLLGGGMSSRLFIEVREKRGLAYYIRAQIEEYADNGYFAVQAGVDAKKLKEAIKVILAEFARLRQGEIDDEELRKAKEYLKGRLILSLEDSQAVAGSYASQELLKDKVLTPAMIIDEIEGVTRERIQAVAEEIFTAGGANLAVLGPEADENNLRRLLANSLS